MFVLGFGDKLNIMQSRLLEMQGCQVCETLLPNNIQNLKDVARKSSLQIFSNFNKNLQLLFQSIPPSIRQQPLWIRSKH